MSREFKYDVFLSHSLKDEPVVRELAQRLKRDGLRVWFHEWEVGPGDAVGQRIEEGLEASRVLVLAISSNALQSQWTTLENGTFRFRDATDKERRFIPLLLDDVEIKDTLKQFAYVDWRKRTKRQYAVLLAACRPVDTGAWEHEIPFGTIPAKPFSLGHIGGVRSVGLSGDGRRAVSGSADKTVRMWDVDTGHCLRTLEGHKHPVLSVGLSGDGRRAISGSEDKTVRVWDVETGLCLGMEGEKYVGSNLQNSINQVRWGT
jgi:WD40 repeat protein